MKLQKKYCKYTPVSSQINIITDPRKISSSDWEEFIRQNGGYIFQTPQMWEVYLTQEYLKICFVAILKNGKIQAVSLGYIQPLVDGLLGQLIKRTVIQGGPLFVKDVDEVIPLLMLSEINKQVKSKSVYTQIRNYNETLAYKLAFDEKKFKKDDHLDIIINLKKNEIDLFSDMHSTRRKQIRRSYKRGIRCELIEDYSEHLVKELYTLLAKLYKQISLPLASFDLINETVKQFMPKGWIRIFVAYLGNKIVGFRMVLTYNSIIFDWYAASEKELQDKYINDVLPWEVIKWGSLNGYDYFDFGGAGKPNKEYGVRDFKLKFGGEMVNYGRYEKINMPLLMAVGKIGLEIKKWCRI